MSLDTSGFDIRESFTKLIENVGGQITTSLQAGVAASTPGLDGLAADISIDVVRGAPAETFPSIQLWFYQGAGGDSLRKIERCQMNILVKSTVPEIPDDRLLLIIRDSLQFNMGLRIGRSHLRAYFDKKGYFLNPTTPSVRNGPRVEFADSGGWGPLPNENDDPFVSGITRDFNIFYK